MNKTLVVLLLALLMVGSFAFKLGVQGKGKKHHDHHDDEECDDDDHHHHHDHHDDEECDDDDHHHHHDHHDDEDCDDDDHHHHHHHHDDEDCDDDDHHDHTHQGQCECTWACDVEFTHEKEYWHKHKHDHKDDEECEDDDKDKDHKHKDKDHKHKDKDHKHKDKDHKHKGNPANTCGESDAIYAAWQAAKSQAWQNGKSMSDVVDYCIKGAQDAGADCELTTCIGVHCGTGTGMATCAIVDYMKNWADNNGASSSTANEWTQKSMSKVYSWYKEGDC